MVSLYYSLFSSSIIGEQLGYFQFYVSTNIVDKNILVQINLCAHSLVSMGRNSTSAHFPQTPFLKNTTFMYFSFFFWHVHISTFLNNMYTVVFCFINSILMS